MRWKIWLSVAALVGAVTPLGPAHADASDQQAYEAAMKCYVVAGNASEDRKKVGDQEKAAAYEGKARAAFGVAVKFGRTIGLSRAQMTRDFEATQESELRKLVADVDYNRQSAAVCRALGLL